MNSSRRSRAPSGALILLVFGTGMAGAGQPGRIENNLPIPNAAGAAATYSTAGYVDLTNPFHKPQGTNGRTCQTCHLPHAGWRIRPIDVELTFLLTLGQDPIFNLLDANSPNAPTKTLGQRYQSYSMLRKGLFRRGGNVPENAEYQIVAVDDPLRAGGSLTRFEFFRRPLATANFHIAKNVGWHDQFTDGGLLDVHAGLKAQARPTIIGALAGQPPTEETLEAIATHQEELSFAQSHIFGLGSLSSCGAKGGPEHLSRETPVNGRFDLFDAWIDLVPGSCTTKAADRKRAQIARGQELFNNPGRTGKTCRSCHNAANNGSNVNGTLFDVGASRKEFRKAGMPLYTLRNKADPKLVHKTTDPGRALKTGKWNDLDKFKTPSLRGVAARAPYFHNGIAPTLKDVVIHYEKALGFKFTAQEREDLVAFLEAL